MLFLISNFFIDYLCYLIGGLIQAIFILLPVTLKNWEDDTLNSLTYISFQLFTAGIIFIVSPWIFEVKLVSIWMLTVLFGSVGLISVFRVVKLIPFEFTYPVKVNKIVYKDISFSQFITLERQNLLFSIDFQSPDAQLRYNAFREKLCRIQDKKTAAADESF